MEVAFKSNLNKFSHLYSAGISLIAPLIDEKTDKLSDKYLILDSYMIIGNFGGYPSITIPSGFVSSMPVGINITGKKFADGEVLNIANKIEGLMEYRNQIAKEMK